MDYLFLSFDGITNAATLAMIAIAAAVKNGDDFSPVCGRCTSALGAVTIEVLGLVLVIAIDFLVSDSTLGAFSFDSGALGASTFGASA